MRNIEQLNKLLSKLYPGFSFTKDKNKNEEKVWYENSRSFVINETALNPFRDDPSVIIEKSLDEAIQQIEEILESVERAAKHNKQVLGEGEAKEENEFAYSELSSESPEEESKLADKMAGKSEEELCCFDDAEDDIIYYADDEGDLDDVEAEGKVVEGYLIAEDKFKELLESEGEFKNFVKEIFEITEEVGFDKVRVYTSEFYHGVPKGYVLISLEDRLLSEAISKKRKLVGRMVLGGRIVTGAKRVKLKIYRKRYYRRKKARLKIRHRRARMRRKARGGRVSQREYRRERAMKLGGTLRRKKQVLKPGRKGFTTIKEEDGTMEGKFLWEAFQETIPDIVNYRLSYYQILSRAVEKLDEAIAEGNRVKAHKVVSVFEKYFNNLTSLVAENLVSASSNLLVEEDELLELQAVYNEFVDYINDLLNELRSYLVAKDFDGADEVLYDLRDSIDDFFGYLYPEEGEPEEADWEEDEYYDTDVEEEPEGNDEDFVVPISDDTEDLDNEKDSLEDEEDEEK